MMSFSRSALALLLPPLLVGAVVANEQCGDADCEFNVQLLQQDLNLKSELVHSEAEVGSVPSDFEPPKDQPTIDEMIADLDVDHESNYTYLRYLETKLTDAVHAQALVVSEATDTYQSALAVDDSANNAQDSLDDQLDTAKTNEDIAQGTHASLEFLIAGKKAQLDALENATNEANETLQAVKPKYLAAEAAYQAALKGTDPIQDHTETQEAEYEEAQAALDAAESAQRAADLAVHNQTMKLQKEIKELNDKNDDLRDVQEELGRPLPPSE